MMGYGYGGGWMWGFGGLMMLCALILIGLVVWAIVAATSRGRPAAGAAFGQTDGRERTRQVLDERYARGEMSTEDYAERMHALGL